MMISRYAEAYELGPLAPDSSYEAKVAAKNAYGWSEQSKVFIFYTQGKGKYLYSRIFGISLLKLYPTFIAHVQIQLLSLLNLCKFKPL